MKERNMDSQVREKNSSFQNVNLFITAISKRGSTGTGFTVRLSDGSSFFVSKIFTDQNNLSKDQIINEDLLEKLEIESQSIQALIKAADLIARAEQSSGGLYRKLKKKGFPDYVCSYAVDKVKSANLLNDYRFSEMWIFSRLRSHPEGKMKLYAGLISRGVPSEKAQAALNNCLSEDDLQISVMKAGKKIMGKYEISDQKFHKALYRRGFSSREIKYFLENIEV